MRRDELWWALAALCSSPVLPMKFLGHEERRHNKSEKYRALQTTNSSGAGTPSEMPYYHSLFVLAPDAATEFTRAFNGLARIRKSCFYNPDLDAQMFLEVKTRACATTLGPAVRHPHATAQGSTHRAKSALRRRRVWVVHVAAL